MWRKLITIAYLLSTVSISQYSSQAQASHGTFVPPVPSRVVCNPSTSFCWAQRYPRRWAYYGASRSVFYYPGFGWVTAVGCDFYGRNCIFVPAFGQTGGVYTGYSGLFGFGALGNRFYY